VAAREILGPLNLGLVGLMLACLMAAMMSSADTYMIVTSGLVTRNVYSAFINKHADEKTCLRVARGTGLLIIIGASVVSLSKGDVFAQFKLAMELPILFAAPFWIGMFWRKANARAVWATIAFSAIFFFVLPILMPTLRPDMRNDPALTQPTYLTTQTMTRAATAADVAKHQAWVKAIADAKGDAAMIAKIGPEPPSAAEGETIEVVSKSGGKSIFWRDGVSPVGEATLETVSEETDGNTRILVQRYTNAHVGNGSFNVDFLLYYWMGVDLTDASKATIETLRLPPRLLMPFLVLMIVSLFTRRERKEVLDRYFVKMRTVVHPDPETDRQQLEAAYANPEHYERRKLFPKSDWEFTIPRPVDVIGFLVSVAICFVIVALLAWLAGIGS
jgi:SSS family solute:Na+ symporter